MGLRSQSAVLLRATALCLILMSSRWTREAGTSSPEVDGASSTRYNGRRESFLRREFESMIDETGMRLKPPSSRSTMDPDRMRVTSAERSEGERDVQERLALPDKCSSSG